MPSITKGANVYRPSMSVPQAPPISAASSSSEDSGGASNNSSSDPSTILVPRTFPIEAATPPPPSSPPPALPRAPSMTKTASKKRKEAPSNLPSLTSPSISDLTISSLVDSSGSSSKRARVSGPVALHGIKEEMSVLNSTLRSAVDHKTRVFEHNTANIANSTTPLDIKKRAEDILQEKEAYLDDDCLLTMFDIFRSDVGAAQTYVGIRRDSLRRRWVKRELERLGRLVPDYPPPDEPQ